MPVFVKASRRAKAYVRSGGAATTKTIYGSPKPKIHTVTYKGAKLHDSKSISQALKKIQALKKGK